MSPAEPLHVVTSVSAYLAGYKEPSRTRAWPVPFKVRPRHRLRVILDGSATFVVGASRVTVGPGTVLVIPPHVPDTGVQDAEHLLRYALLHAVVRVWGESVPGGPHGFCHACFSGDYPTPPPTDPDKLRYGCGC